MHGTVFPLLSTLNALCFGLLPVLGPNRIMVRLFGPAKVRTVVRGSVLTGNFGFGPP